MKLSHLLALASLSLALGPLGCAAETSSDGGGDAEEVAGDEADLTAARDHFTPFAVSLTWLPGCGIPKPGGGACAFGLKLGFTKTFPDLSVTTTTSVNNTTNTITVKLDTWSKKGAPHALGLPSPDERLLGIPLRLQIGKTYSVRVLDFTGATISTGSIVAVPAA